MRNIVAAGRRRRFVLGLIVGAIAVVTAVRLVVASAGPGWFVLLFLLSVTAAMMLIQAGDGT